MDRNELRKMTVPKLRELAKNMTNVEGASGLKKEELIEAIAKAQGIPHGAEAKDEATISSVKHEIRELKKKGEELRASSTDWVQLRRVRKKIKRLKRLTRLLARQAAVLAKTEAPKEEAPKESKGSEPPPPTPEGGESTTPAS